MVELREGDILDGRYRIGATIARGGMSTVHRATDLRLGRHVAAKVMDPRFVDDVSFRTRFEREARAVATMTDATLVNVYDQGIDAAGHVFLIMELVDGGTLRELLRERGPMPPHAVAAVMAPVLHALSIAHGNGMVHRDIKPENVLISDSGRVKLADFGLVRAVADAKITSNSVIVGTVAYLSPEQVTGADITPASDVYSAGVLLFELLTGETPFTGDSSLGIAMKRLSDDVPPPSEFIDGVPPQFDDLVRRACARNPQDRYGSASEFESELAAVVGQLGLPQFRVPAPQDSAAHRAKDAAETQQRTRPDQRLDFSENATETWQLSDDDWSAENSHAPAIADSQQPDRSPQQRAGRQRTRTGCALWLIIALVATFGMGLGAWWLGSGRYGEVPSISGMSQSQALSTLADAGFEPTTATEYHNSVPKTQIIGSKPPVGTKFVRGKSVAVVLSLGKPLVPNYPSSSSAARYTTLLTERTLVEKAGDDVYSDYVPRGGVVYTAPSQGTEVLVGSTVVVHHSKGVAPVKVPDVVGDSESAARRKLEAAGLVVGDVTKKFDESAKADTVLETDPPVGEGVDRAAKVALVINSAISVPDVKGMSKDAAIAALRAQGLRVSETSSAPGSSQPNGKVEKTSPAAGKLVDPDDPRVELYVSDRASVPLIIGMTVADARAALEREGLELDIKNDGGDNAIVITQSPRAGKALKSGDKVSVRAL